MLGIALAAPSVASMPAKGPNNIEWGVTKCDTLGNKIRGYPLSL